MNSESPVDSRRTEGVQLPANTQGQTVPRTMPYYQTLIVIPASGTIYFKRGKLGNGALPTIAENSYDLKWSVGDRPIVAKVAPGVPITIFTMDSGVQYTVIEENR
ncbi:hypothetical protein EON79_21020 [bacterium]|nr:MAG: hypothetical protein EON79_21020 [bacterium]